MRRRRRKVDGATLDLTRVEEGAAFTVEDVLVHEVVKPQRHECICVSCETTRMCTDICGSSMCYMCMRLQGVSAEVVQYIRDAYRGPCSLCRRYAVSYHYDHLNMFDKGACVLDLVHMPIDVIAAEIAKCQLVCVPCHAVITTAEARLGYLKKKIRMGRDARAGKDISEARVEFATQYARDFAAVYAGLRGGAAGDLTGVS